MPEVNQVHIDTALTNVSVAYNNNDYIADRIAPPVPVRKQSDRYFIYDTEREGMRVTPDNRAPGAEAEEVNFALSSDSYYCDDHALSTAIPDEERENADPAIQPDIDRTEFLTERIMLNREVALEEKLRTHSGIPEIAISGGNEWDSLSSDPLSTFRSAIMSIFAQTQRRANIAVIPYGVFETLRNHDDIVERIKYSQGTAPVEELIARIIGVDTVLVPRCYKNVATKGQAPSIQGVWGDNVYLLHAPQRPALKQVALAYTFTWNGMPGTESGTLVERWREPRRKADMIRVQKYYDHKIVAAGAGCRITNTLG